MSRPPSAFLFAVASVSWGGRLRENRSAILVLVVNKGNTSGTWDLAWPQWCHALGTAALRWNGDLAGMPTSRYMFWGRFGQYVLKPATTRRRCGRQENGSLPSRIQGLGRSYVR